MARKSSGMRNVMGTVRHTGGYKGGVGVSMGRGGRKKGRK